MNVDEQTAETRRTFATWLALFIPFTPIGKEGGLRRAPLAVPCLIVLNVAVHLVAWPIEQKDQSTEARGYEGLAEAELAVEVRWLGSGGDQVFGWSPSSRSRGRTAFEEKFWESFAAGRITAMDDELFLDWKRAHDAWQEAKSDRLFHRWGTRRGNPNHFSFLSAMFLHAGFWHLFGNMFFLWVAGSALEDVWGPRFLLLLYLCAGLLAQVPDAFFLPARDIPGVGASGAVAGLMGAFLVKMHAQKLHFIILPMLPTVLLPGWVFFLPWGVLEFRNALSGKFSGIAHSVHVGGFLAGGLVALVYRLSQSEKLASLELARTDAKAVQRKRAAIEERAADRLRHGYNRGVLEDLIEACEVDPGPHASYSAALDRLLAGGSRERAAGLALMTLRTLWVQGRKEEHASAFAMMSERGLADTLPSIELLHASDSLSPRRPRQAAEALHAFLTARPDDPLAKAALNRYADLLEALGHPEAAAQARSSAASIKPRPA